MCDNLTCSICTEDLTIKNIINTECNHPTCKSCFWRWAKDKNTCPFCREHLLKNDEEAKDIQQMRELLTHKGDIIRQVERAYEEEEDLLESIGRKYKELGEIKLKAHNVEKKLKKMEKSQGGKYKTYKYLKKQMEETKRINRFGVHDDQTFSNYKKVVSDIKSLSKQCPFSLFRTDVTPSGSHSQWLLNHVRYMERKRKERRKIKAYNDNIDEEPIALDTLFSQEEEFYIPNVPYIADSLTTDDMDLSNVGTYELINGPTFSFPPSLVAAAAASEPPLADVDWDYNLVMPELEEIDNHQAAPSSPSNMFRTPPQSPHTLSSPPTIRRERGRNIQRTLENFSPLSRQENDIRRQLINDTPDLNNIFRDMILRIMQEENDELSNID